MCAYVCTCLHLCVYFVVCFVRFKHIRTSTLDVVRMCHERNVSLHSAAIKDMLCVHARTRLLPVAVGRQSRHLCQERSRRSSHARLDDSTTHGPAVTRGRHAHGGCRRGGAHIGTQRQRRHTSGECRRRQRLMCKSKMETRHGEQQRRKYECRK